MTAKIFFATATLILAATSAANAHPIRPIDRTLDQQEAKIEQGRQTGQITWREGRKLRAEQRQIESLRADYLSDGKLTGREYRDLRRRQEKAAWNIINEKYDGWRRLRFLPRVGR